MTFHIFTRNANRSNKVKILALILLTWQPEYSKADIGEVVGDVWDKLWSVSCEFSSRTVSRTRRSLEFPNTDNTEEFFQYLYPSLNLNAEEVLAEGARSLSLNSWMEDLVEYWEVECRKAKRKIVRQDETPEESTTSGNSTDSTFGGLNNSTMANAKDSAGDLGSFQNASESLNKTIRQANQIFGVTVPGPWNALSGVPGAAQQFLVGSSTSTTTMRTPTFSPLALHRDNRWFSNYGGDIEYFFPLIGFGIPFDGEITLLGFHGFKGLFPYKR